MITFLPYRLAIASDLVPLKITGFQFSWDVVLITRIGYTLTAFGTTFCRHCL